MTTKTKFMLYCGALFTVCAVGCFLLLFFGGDSTNGWWIGATALSSGWIFAGIAFGPARWALTAVPTAIVGLFAFFYAKDHPFELRAWILVALAVMANVLLVFFDRRVSREQIPRR